MLRGPLDLVVTEVPDPEAGPHDIVVRVAASGICGSDLASYATGAYVRPGQIMGHEFAGTVHAVGDGVVGLVPGQRVTVRPLGQCGVCRACSLGLRHVCERGIRDALGYGHPGAFAELVRVPGAVLDDNVFVLDDTVDDSAGASVEPFAVALHAVRRLGVEAGDSTVVLGLGPVGLAAVQVLRALGVERIVGIDGSEFRRSTGARCGAVAVAGSDDMEQVVRGIAGPGPRGRHGGADVVLEASGASMLLWSAPSLLRTGGRLGLVALYREPIALDMNDWVTRELELVGCYGYADEFGDALEMVMRGQLDPTSLVTATYPLDAAVEAFRAQADPRRQVKVHLRPQDPPAPDRKDLP